ncbi:MAG: cation transporter [Rhodobacteraceae bacterium]|nr:cation transporter [Paracoccaceae bacterium]
MALAQNIEFGIAGMSCTGCSGKVEKALTEAAGILEVDVSLEDAKAVISFDPDQISGNSVLKIVQDKGFETSEKKKPLN